MPFHKRWNWRKTIHTSGTIACSFLSLISLLLITSRYSRKLYAAICHLQLFLHVSLLVYCLCFVSTTTVSPRTRTIPSSFSPLPHVLHNPFSPSSFRRVPGMFIRKKQGYIGEHKRCSVLPFSRSNVTQMDRYAQCYTLPQN